jgi:hypothetical protein
MRERTIARPSRGCKAGSGFPTVAGHGPSRSPSRNRRIDRLARRWRASAQNIAFLLVLCGVLGRNQPDVELAPRDGRDRGRPTAPARPRRCLHLVACVACPSRRRLTATDRRGAGAGERRARRGACSETSPTRFGRDLEGVVDVAFAAAVLRGSVRQRSLGGPAIALEAGRLASGTLYTARCYFLRAEAPDRDRARAGRIATPIRAAGMIVAAVGRRRAAETLVCVAAAADAAAALAEHERARQTARGRACK